MIMHVTIYHFIPVAVKTEMSSLPDEIEITIKHAYSSRDIRMQIALIIHVNYVASAVVIRFSLR